MSYRVFHYDKNGRCQGESYHGKSESRHSDCGETHAPKGGTSVAESAESLGPVLGVLFVLGFVGIVAFGLAKAKTFVDRVVREMGPEQEGLPDLSWDANSPDARRHFPDWQADYQRDLQDLLTEFRALETRYSDDSLTEPWERELEKSNAVELENLRVEIGVQNGPAPELESR